MLADEAAKVVRHGAAGPGYRFLALCAPRIAAALVPGQFVHVKVPGLEASALRRPFSVFDADAESGEVTVMYKIVGRGTEALSRVAVGDEVCVMGALGNGFPLGCRGTPLLVGGGYGVAPLHFLAKRLVRDAREGCGRPILFVGGRTGDDLLAVDRFEAMGVDVRTATNDGSVGVKGFVTAPLDDALAGLARSGERFELFTCGPDGLLRAVADRALAAGMPGWISMDRHMVCGVGACFACIQKVRRPNGEVYNARCCVNGPVFAAADIVWDA